MSEKQNDDVRIMRALDVLAGRDGDRMRRANAFVAAMFGCSRKSGGASRPAYNGSQFLRESSIVAESRDEATDVRIRNTPKQEPKSAEDSLAEQMSRCTPDRLRGTHEVLDQVRKAAK